MLKVDSRKIDTGDTFIAIKSSVRDGHDYIEEAIDHGAACIIAEHGEYSVKTVIVPDTRIYLANYLKELYADKLSKLTLIAVTGTNGKTASCYLMYDLLNHLGKKTAYIGNIGFYLPETNKPLNGIPDIYDIYEMLVEAANNDCSVVVMEVSSSDLDNRHFEGLKFDMCCLTNIAKDKLEKYGTIDNYKANKLKLFNRIKRGGYAVINMDDIYGKDFVLENNRNLLFGIGIYDYQISDVTLSTEQSTFKITHDGITKNVVLPLSGIYNIYNYMNAYILCDKLKFNLDLVIAETLNLTSAPGCYQRIGNDKYSVIIDYAHTPYSVEKVIKSVRQFAKGRIFTIIGCGGDNDKNNRPLIGKIAIDNSDYVIFTTDNPRSEKPEDILNEITGKLTKTNFEVIVDRKEAIKKAMNLLEENDTLLVLGKGYEEYQITQDDKVHLNDYEEVMKYIK